MTKLPIDFISLVHRVMSERETGKTQLLKMGVGMYDREFFLVCNSIKEGRRITNNPKCVYITPNSYSKLIGRIDIPIIIDHEVLNTILADSISSQLWNS
jgi:hypothetical protein